MPPSVTVERLRKRSQFLFVRAGQRVAKPSVLIEARRREETGPVGLGFTASRKVGNAVLRNRARRRLREAGRLLMPELGLPGVDYVIVARPSTPHAAWGALLDDVRNALIRLADSLEGGGASSPGKRRAKRPQSPTESD